MKKDGVYKDMDKTTEQEVKKLLPEIIKKAQENNEVGEEVGTSKLRELFGKYHTQTEEDKKLLKGRKDDKLSQTIRNISSHQSEEVKEYPEGFIVKKPAKEAIFSLVNKEIKDINFKSDLSVNYEYNRIIFGAPGTGKSYRLDKDMQNLLSNGGSYERVTFHPDYSYANFVGTYKPITIGKDISYKYVPGPFMRTYVKALQDLSKPHLLIIEEINRANVAAVFGDVFQLLDRDDDGVSEYSIEATEDIKNYLAKELGNNYDKIKIPNNMFIWATMNSADQGVFPMDTAFKRRWNFEYLGIDDGQEDMEPCEVTLGKGDYKVTIEWNELRKAINRVLSSYKLNEDKLLGPFFLSQKLLRETTPENSEKFIETFKSKVIMYLFEDAARQRRNDLFIGVPENARYRYSEICQKFDSIGIDIFGPEISEILGN